MREYRLHTRRPIYMLLMYLISFLGSFLLGLGFLSISICYSCISCLCSMAMWWYLYRFCGFTFSNILFLCKNCTNWHHAECVNIGCIPDDQYICSSCTALNITIPYEETEPKQLMVENIAITNNGCISTDSKSN
jgi:hypothetical protein